MKNRIVLIFFLLLGISTLSAQKKEECSLYGIINKEGKEILPVEYNLIETSKHSSRTDVKNAIGRYIKNSMNGVIDVDGQIKTPPFIDRFKFATICGFFYGEISTKVEKFGRLLSEANYSALYNKEGKALTPPKYSRFEDLNCGLISVYTPQTGWGVIDTTGREIIPCIYNKAAVKNNGNFIFLIKGEEQGIASGSGKIIIPPKKQEIEFEVYNNQKQEIGSVTIDGKSGLIDTTGRWMIPLEYRGPSVLGKNLRSITRIKDNRKGLVNLSGEIITSLEYDDATALQGNGTGAILHKEGIWIYVDSLAVQKFTSPHKIDYNPFYVCSPPSYFCPRLVALNDSIGYSAYDSRGNLVEKSTTDKSPTYTWIGYESSNKLQGYKDRWNNVTILPQYKWVSDGFSFGYAVVTPQKSNKLGIINKDNQLVVPAEYDFAGILSDSMCVLKKKGKIAFCDLRGNPKTPFIYSRVSEIQDGYIAVVRDKRLGVCKEATGEEIIPCQYESIDFFSEEYFFYIIVSQNKKVGIIDLQTGKTIIPCLYDEIKMNWGAALVRQSSKWGVVDMATAEQIIPCQWSEIEPIVFGKPTRVHTRSNDWVGIYKNLPKVFKVRNNDLWGLIDESGTEIVIPAYNTIEQYYNDLLVVRKDYDVKKNNAK